MFYKDIDRERYVIGGMSGTSSDGVTVSLIKVKGTYLEKKIEFIAYEEGPYPDWLRDSIFSLYPGGMFDAYTLSKTRHNVMGIYVNTIERLIRKTGIPKEELSLICFQGPILYYDPPLCMELSDPSIIASSFSVPVISFLRAQDISEGGRGAPLSPYVDYLLFHDRKRGRIVQNIGGIANLTAIFPDMDIDEIISFDQGPGNMVIDYVTKKLFGLPYDKDGALAKKGTTNRELLDWLMSHPYITKIPPKTTGREVFGKEFSEKLLARASELGLSPYDIIRTATAFTAEAIATNYERFVFPYGKIDEVILGGGGVYNKTLVDMLKARLPHIKVLTHDDYGIPSLAREALSWGVMGDETLCGTPSNLPHITGAKRKVLQGSIILSKKK